MYSEKRGVFQMNKNYENFYDLPSKRETKRLIGWNKMIKMIMILRQQKTIEGKVVKNDRTCKKK